MNNKKIIKVLFIIPILIILISLMRYNIFANDYDDFLDSFNDLSSSDSNFKQDLNYFIANNPEFYDYDETKITIITPGICCDYTSWNYANSDNSLIDYIERRNCDVYYARLKSTYNSSKITPTYLSDLDFGLNFTYNLNINGQPICVVLSLGNNEASHQIYSYENDTYSKLVIKGVAYDELETLVNYIIYKYMKEEYNDNSTNPSYQLKIPRIQMIGHSRGGLINMQYAIEHPDLVDSLFSIGTPYNGSTLYNYLHTLNANAASEFFVINDGIEDCVNPSSYEALKHYWNEYQNSANENKTKLYAIGGAMSVDFMNCALNDYVGDDDLINFVLALLYQMGFDDLINDQPTFEHNILSPFDRSYSEDISSYFNVVSALNFVANLVGDFFNVDKIDEYCDMARTVIHLLSNMVIETQLNQYVMKNDGLVDINSQQAYGYANAIKFKKVFTYANSDITKLAQSALPAVGHNVEPCDEDIINCILSNINFGTNDHGFNIKKIDNNTYEYIGFNYEKAVSNGTLTFSKIMSENEMIISSKMFDCDYTRAQKLFKNRYDNYWDSYLDSKSNDGIIHIHFQDRCTISDDTFSFLKGQVQFTANSTYMPTIFKSDNVDNYSLIDGSIYHNKKLLKHGISSNAIITDRTIVDIEEINTGAFLCQPIQNININENNMNIESLTIGNYAFYGCSRLDTVNTEIHVDYVDIYSFTRSKMHSGTKEKTINNALIKAKSNETLYANMNSTFDYVAPYALSNYNCNHIVIESNGIEFEKRSLYGCELENIYITASSPNINGSALPSNETHIYSAFNVSNKFNGYTIEDTIYITLHKPNEEPIIKTLVLSPINNQQVVNFTSSELEITGFNGIGYIENDENIYLDEVMTSVNFFEYANHELYLYYECLDSHQYIVDTTTLTYHIVECANCLKKLKSNHEYQTSQLIDNNEPHHNLHLLTCTVCNRERQEVHNIHHGLIEINYSLYYASICDDCGYQCPIVSVSVTDSGDYHTLSIGGALPHEYIVLDYQNLDILVCKYCGHHEHNGLIGSSDGSTTHNLYCYYCETVVHVPHVFDLYQNQNSDLYDGYHTKTCSICNQLIEEGHSFDIDENFNDCHHLKCLNCNVTAIWNHTAAISINPTVTSHAEYCEFCECYYYELHNFSYYADRGIDATGHYVKCSECSYNLHVNHINETYYDYDDPDTGHYIRCIICGYDDEIAIQHSEQYNCLSQNPNEHYSYCSACGYTKEIKRNYERIAEYNHYCTCSICNLRIVENHDEYCYYHNNELHVYLCSFCDDIESPPSPIDDYLMPHFVNDHLIIYENYEPGYDLWVCTYCGYMEIKRREE